MIATATASASSSSAAAISSSERPLPPTVSLFSMRGSSTSPNGNTNTNGGGGAGALERLREARDHEITATLVCKFLCSTALVFFSVAVIVSLIVQEETKVSRDVSPAIALVITVVALTWLFMVEGGQASLVGLPPVDRTLYERTHPIAHRICALAHGGNNLDRYLIGRQFMVLLSKWSWTTPHPFPTPPRRSTLHPRLLRLRLLARLQLSLR